MLNHFLVPRRPVSRSVRPAPAGALWGDGFDRVFDELRRGFGPGPVAREAEFAPRVDVTESDAEIRLSAELPGLEEKDFDVSVEGDVLTLKGEKRCEEQREGEGWSHVESTYGRFERSFRLPFDIDADSVAADYRNGVLAVTVPKPAEARPQTRQIPVTSS